MCFGAMTRRAKSRSGPGLTTPRQRAATWPEIAAVVAVGAALAACANPQGLTVVRGSASASQNGSQLNVTASQNAFLHWQSFNIGAGETTTFHQPSSHSVVWNQIGGQNPSQIWGTLNANGYVVLMNQNGFYFGPNCSINVGGFVAAAAAVLPPPTAGGGAWTYQGPPPTANIINYGQIKVQSGGSLFLIAEGIENHGLLSAPDGQLGLYAGKQVMISERPDGRGLSATVQLPAGSIDNTGQLIADGGAIALHAQVVNQNGLVQADSVRNHLGVIELVAGDTVNLGPNSVLQADGDATVPSAGGRITIKSAQSFADAAGSRLEVRGGALGGDGGSVEISAPAMPAILSQVDGSASPGSVGGHLLIDPQNITLGTSGSGSAGSGTVPANGPPATGTLFLDVNSAFLGLSQIDLQATANITLVAGTTWDLAQSTGISTPGSHLTLEAGNNINLGSRAGIVAGPGWSVTLEAGRNFSSPTAIIPGTGTISLASGSQLQTQDGSLTLVAGKDITLGSGQVTTGGGALSLTTVSGNIGIGAAWNLPQPSPSVGSGPTLSLQAGNSIVFADRSSIVAGTGWSVDLAAGVGIYLNGGGKLNYSGSIETADGDITLNAGHEVLVGKGYIHTDNGGSISITTGNGDVDAGRKAITPYSPYSFTAEGYTVDTVDMGSIGTVAGGDVTINAGRDILSQFANLGAWGAQPGNVTLTAGRDIKGYFTLRNGTGTLNAGENVGDSGTPASFGLVSGGWSITAARDLYLNQVFNPNGALNYNNATYGARVVHQFDYAPDAFVNLVGGNSVQLLGNTPLPAGDNSLLPVIYPPILDIRAGAGGVVLGNTDGVTRGNNLILYPSPLGSLNIQTTEGGSLTMAPGQYGQIVLSDSGSADYTTFQGGHAGTPLHLGGTGAGVHLDISGNLQNIYLTSPEAADIHVHGNAVNFAFQGQNLSASDVTQVQIDGDYSVRSDWTFVTLSDTPNLNALTDPTLSLNPTLGNRLRYDPATHQLGLQNVMNQADLDFLLHPEVYVVNPITGQREVDGQGNPLIAPATFSTDTATLQQLFAGSQDIPIASNAGLRQNGLQLGGPGRFDLSARNMDLGMSEGIRSLGPLNNPALGALSIQGAGITLNLAGNLELTSSQIASFNGGSISVNCLGHVDVGSQESFTSDETPKGIYTGHGGDVTVHAVGDINVQGSRIATYDGGNVTVISDTGSVDAGSGARGLFPITSSAFDPATGQVISRNDKFFGSGIMATTSTDSNARLGDITIQAPHGDILANSGGILQLAFNHQDQSGAKVVLQAGGNIIASHSGVLGANVSLSAGGNIEGLVVASQNVTVQAQQNVAVTVLAGGAASVSAGQTISGTIVGGGSVNVAGADVSASVISTGGSATTSGNTSGASVGAFAGVAAPAAQKTVESGDKTVASQSLAQAGDDDEKKKRAAAKGPTLVRRIGRVTVILPKS